MGVYRNDSGQIMEEDDFFAFVMQVIREFMRLGANKSEAIAKVWGDEYFADSILDIECFIKMKERAQNILNHESLHKVD